jgi:hypothetical protein
VGLVILIPGVIGLVLRILDEEKMLKQELDGYIGIASEQDGVAELGALKDAKQVAVLVIMVLLAPVDQNRQGGNRRYFIAFHLADGTVVT